MAALDTRRRTPGGSTPARRHWAARLAGLLTLAALSCAPAIEAAPLEVYGRLPRLENVALSPDGSRIAFVKTEGNTRLVAVLFVPGLQYMGEAARVLIKVDLDTRDSTIMRVGRVGTLGWVVDEAGEVQAEETYAEKDGRWRIFLRRNSRLQEVASGHEDLEFPDLLGRGP